MRKYWQLSGLQVTSTIELCTARSARWSIPCHNYSSKVTHNDNETANLIDLVHKGERGTCFFREAHQVQDGRQGTLLECARLVPQRWSMPTTLPLRIAVDQ